MSINAINSVSLYEYYYRINKDSQEKKKSPIEKEMREYGLTPTESESLNIAMLKKAKETEKNQNNQSSSESSYADRPWADLMYQLNISFNENPRDDIQDIKDELAILIQGMDDEELVNEIADLESYVENLYLNFNKNSQGSIDTTSVLNNQLNNLSILNKANFL